MIFFVNFQTSEIFVTYNMEESNNPTISLSSEEDENGNTDQEVRDSPRKKLRVSAATVHLEFEQIKNNSGVWTSKCKHCFI